MRLAGAMIYVKDLARLRGFYEGTLGLRAIEETRTDSYVEFDAGGVRFALHAIPAHMAEGIEISCPPRVRETNPVKLIFAVDDLEREQARLQSLGVTVIARPWGGCDGIDPEGNVFGIHQTNQ